MSIVLVQDIRDALGLGASVTDTTIQALIDDASGVIADHVGALEPTAMTYAVNVALGGMVPLPNVRVISVDAMTSPWYTAIDTTQLLFINGVVRYVFGVVPAGPWTINYTAGWPTGGAPPQIKRAVIELCRHMWEPQRGNTFNRGNTQPAMQAPSTAHLLPWRVEELIAPYVIMGGFA